MRELVFYLLYNYRPMEIRRPMSGTTVPWKSDRPMVPEWMLSHSNITTYQLFWQWKKKNKVLSRLRLRGLWDFERAMGRSDFHGTVRFSWDGLEVYGTVGRSMGRLDSLGTVVPLMGRCCPMSGTVGSFGTPRFPWDGNSTIQYTIEPERTIIP